MSATAKERANAYSRDRLYELLNQTHIFYLHFSGIKNPELLERNLSDEALLEIAESSGRDLPIEDLSELWEKIESAKPADLQALNVILFEGKAQ